MYFHISLFKCKLLHHFSKVFGKYIGTHLVNQSAPFLVIHPTDTKVPIGKDRKQIGCNNIV